MIGAQQIPCRPARALSPCAAIFPEAAVWTLDSLEPPLSSSTLPPLPASPKPRYLKHRIMDEGSGATPFSRTITTPSTSGESRQGDREAAIDAEMTRVNKLPANSSYAIHRMKVLNKLRHLFSIKRTTSQDEELELLFATLSI